MSHRQSVAGIRFKGMEDSTTVTPETMPRGLNFNYFGEHTSLNTYVDEQIFLMFLHHLDILFSRTICNIDRGLK